MTESSKPHEASVSHSEFCGNVQYMFGLNDAHRLQDTDVIFIRNPNLIHSVM